MDNKQNTGGNLPADLNDNPQYQLPAVIEKFKLNKTYLAQQMNMPAGTFKNKLNLKQEAYKFTKDEYLKLIGVLTSIADQLKTAIYTASYIS